MSAIFLFRVHPLISFSRRMAANTSPNISQSTRRFTSYLAVKPEFLFVLVLDHTVEDAVGNAGIESSRIAGKNV